MFGGLGFGAIGLPFIVVLFRLFEGHCRIRELLVLLVQHDIKHSRVSDDAVKLLAARSNRGHQNMVSGGHP